MGKSVDDLIRAAKEDKEVQELVKKIKTQKAEEEYYDRLFETELAEDFKRLNAEAEEMYEKSFKYYPGVRPT